MVVGAAFNAPSNVVTTGTSARAATTPPRLADTVLFWSKTTWAEVVAEASSKPPPSSALNVWKTK